eukprot:1556427-Amphidinium_carterae.1
MFFSGAATTLLQVIDLLYPQPMLCVSSLAGSRLVPLPFPRFSFPPSVWQVAEMILQGAYYPGGSNHGRQ